MIQKRVINNKNQEKLEIQEKTPKNSAENREVT